MCFKPDFGDPAKKKLLYMTLPKLFQTYQLTAVFIKNKIVFKNTLDLKSVP